MRRNRLFIIEGPDCSGKTTLARRICFVRKAMYIHASGDKSLHPGMQAYHMSLLRIAEENLNQGYDVVLDRHWPSEYVYTMVLGDRYHYDYDAILKELSKFDLTYVFCYDDKVPDRHQEQLDSNHPYSRNQIIEILATYQKLSSEPFIVEVPVIHYSLEKNGHNMLEFIEKL